MFILNELKGAISSIAKEEFSLIGGAKYTRGLPERWFLGWKNFRCVNDHVGSIARTIHSAVGCYECPYCFGDAVVTFPEDEEGRLSKDKWREKMSEIRILQSG